MIQPLRTVHRRAFILLGVLLAAILLAGLGARRSNAVPATQTAVPAVGAAAPGNTP